MVFVSFLYFGKVEYMVNMVNDILFIDDYVVGLLVKEVSDVFIKYLLVGFEVF